MFKIRIVSGINQSSALIQTRDCIVTVEGDITFEQIKNAQYDGSKIRELECYKVD